MNIFKDLAGDTYNLILYLNAKDKDTLNEFINSSEFYVSPFIYILNKMPAIRNMNYKEQFENKINDIYSIFNSYKPFRKGIDKINH